MNTYLVELISDLDERFVYHQMNDLQPKYWRILQKTKPRVEDL